MTFRISEVRLAIKVSLILDLPNALKRGVYVNSSHERVRGLWVRHCNESEYSSKDRADGNIISIGVIIFPP